MKKNHYTHDQLKELAADYFTSNPDVDYLLASTHDGVFYRPENAGYAQAGADANGAELVKVPRAAEAVAVAVTSRAMNINIKNLSVHTLGHVDDLSGFLVKHLSRVANGETVETVLTEMLAGVPETLELTVDLPELDEQPGLAALVAEAVLIPGYFATPAEAPASTEAAPAQAEVAAATTAPAEAAPAPKKTRTTAPKKTPVAPKAAKSTKPKASTKAAE
ncbi:hypothetical protein [Hymenobacter glacieicola]|uniref:Uncharacterized protein n=1 Tax=Hymenobacter glacieicola TaxID=1562124 RepID=A0ABQ1WN35_9BACT|nr:hypothetical protein [Hymenobacter glacieicola]GGG33370.1 hypothetical protein GCM10011378_07310 [Hymenobacter glacieicola]